MTAAYYNEFDPFAADWLKNLISAGLIAPGDVDRRDIRDVHPDDLKGYDQHHFFAGIGTWSYALRQAGWEDDAPVWTVSCPCQPFSEAGRNIGFDDDRHLWPAIFHFTSILKPDVLIGEQVSSKSGAAWLDLVQSDLEGENYSFGACDLPASGFGSPNIRQRFFWVAESDRKRRERLGLHIRERELSPDMFEIRWKRQIGRVADTEGAERPWGETARHGRTGTSGISQSSRVADTDSAARERLPGGFFGAQEESYREGLENGPFGDGYTDGGEVGGRGTLNGFWGEADWLYCRDAKWRPVEPGSFPLVDGSASRVGRLRAYGNAINAEVAKHFIEAYIGDGL